MLAFSIVPQETITAGSGESNVPGAKIFLLILIDPSRFSFYHKAHHKWACFYFITKILSYQGKEKNCREIFNVKSESFPIDQFP
jgi:hypothetical protein